MVADIGKKKIRNVVRKTCAESRKVRLLKDVKIKKRFYEKGIKLVDVGVPNLHGHFKDVVFMACDAECVRE